MSFVKKKRSFLQIPILRLLTFFDSSLRRTIKIILAVKIPIFLFLWPQAIDLFSHLHRLINSIGLDKFYQVEWLEGAC